MKKLLALLLVFSVCLTGCSGDKKSDADSYEVALVTDAGDINDKSFNQSAWEAVEAFAGEYDFTYKYYKPISFDTAGYISSIEEAVDNGAKVIVCPGFKFSDAIGSLQSEYTDVNFILIDATPTIDGAPCEVGDNVYCVTYLETQPGYLAGYAAVMDGYTDLGYMGGIALPAVINFGFGYVQGAEAAAKELGITVKMRYYYTGSFNPSTEIKTAAASWYSEGCEVIFACGGGICDSIFAAAEEAGAKTIGVDSDQKDASETVITSALKGVNKTVFDALVDYSEGKCPSGYLVLDASGDYVGLPTDFSRFNSFNEDQYTALFDGIKDGSISIKTNDDYVDKAGDPTVFASDSLEITYITD